MNLAKIIEMFHREAHRRWAQDSVKTGLTHSEFEYLRAIKDQEARKTDKHDHGQHLQDMVAEMGVRKASASSMVTKLEERGFVHRLPCRFDARSQHILLTPEGENMLKTGEGIYQAIADGLLLGLGSTDRMELETVFGRIAAAS
jgi:DNA-binding MarR family transcriptional regulator